MAGRGDGAADVERDPVGDVVLLRRAVRAGRAVVADVRVGVRGDPVGVDVGVGRDEPTSAEDPPGVELEVRVLVAHRRPVEQALIGEAVDVAEGAGEVDGLARTGLEGPRHGVGVTVGVAGGAAAPAAVGPERARGEEVDLAPQDAERGCIGRKVRGADALHDGVADQVRDHHVTRRRADDVAVRAVGVEHDAARVAARARRVGGIDGEDARHRALGERPRARRRVDRRLARGVEVHADDEIAALAHDPARAGRRGAVDVHRHRREQPVGVVTDLRVEQACRHVEVDAAVHVEGLVGDLGVGGLRRTPRPGSGRSG